MGGLFPVSHRNILMLPSGLSLLCSVLLSLSGKKFVFSLQLRSFI